MNNGFAFIFIFFPSETNDRAIINVLVHHNNFQRQKILSAYEDMYEKVRNEETWILGEKNVSSLPKVLGYENDMTTSFSSPLR